MVELADVIVIGMGPGGEEVAGRLAEAGMSVIGVEAGLVGGECPYWGCVPSKMMIRAANLLAEARRVPGMAGTSVVEPDWNQVASRIRREATDNWDDRVAVERFESKGGRFVRGEGHLSRPGGVTVGEQEFAARKGIVLATGAGNRPPKIEGLGSIGFWSNRDVMELKELPRSLAVLGGGAIGLEIGQTFSRFGVEVTIVEAADRLLPAEDPDASAVITAVLRSENITVKTGVKVSRVSYDSDHYHLDTDDGSVAAERLLVATGRRPDLGRLGVEAIGIDPSSDHLETDAQMRVAPGVWAVGDVTGIGAFTHMAMYQARIAADCILGVPVSPADYRALPRVTFTDPEVASVGLTEQAARDLGLRVRVGMTTVESSARGWIHKAGNAGLIKLIEDTDRGVLVGAVSVGPCGGEVLGMLTLAVHSATPVALMRNMIYAYPTFHRGVESALAELA
jgi:pyruvate/2-oxoglutarate dehydrogenase complex dihydrolipoamide dehydrogenase (E3) component